MKKTKNARVRKPTTETPDDVAVDKSEKELRRNKLAHSARDPDPGISKKGGSPLLLDVPTSQFLLVV